MTTRYARSLETRTLEDAHALGVRAARRRAGIWSNPFPRSMKARMWAWAWRRGHGVCRGCGLCGRGVELAAINEPFKQYYERWLERDLVRWV